MPDAGISTASITSAYRLGFIPLYSARYDLVILKEYLEQFTSTAVYRYLGTSEACDRFFEVLGDYDIRKMAEVITNI